jgi:peroxin-6
VIKLSPKDSLTVADALDHEQYTNHPHPHPVTPQYYLAEMAKQEEMEIIVTESDLDLALKNIIPSVSQVEMGHYIETRKQFLT